MMRQIRSRHGEFGLNLTDYQAIRMSGKQEAQNPQALFAANCGEHIGEARSLVGGACFHISMVMEVWKRVKTISCILVTNDPDHSHFVGGTVAGAGASGPAPPVMSVCESVAGLSALATINLLRSGASISMDSGRDVRRSVRMGCGPFIDLRRGDWNELNDAEVRAEMAAKAGQHPEVWVTVVGRLQTSVRSSHLGPCDKKSWHLPGFGHLGAFPAQITVDRFVELELRENPQSRYDYANMYHGPM